MYKVFATSFSPLPSGREYDIRHEGIKAEWIFKLSKMASNNIVVVAGGCTSALLIAAPDENGRVKEGIMALEISDEIRSRTTRCPFGFKCLEVGANQLCPVERYLQGNGLFLRKNKRDYCPYLMSFGQQYICNCPTHVELYQQHHI